MATRATYEFVSEWSPTTVIYKHHDGYPQGAAQWLKNVRTAEDFIRKNDEAELLRRTPSTVIPSIATR